MFCLPELLLFTVDGKREYKLQICQDSKLSEYRMLYLIIN